MTGLQKTIAAFAMLALAACGVGVSDAQISPHPAPSGPHLAQAVFAGGCFWSMETDFDHLDGVVETIDGYTGGQLAHPTYEQVSTETTGHYESVRVTYDTTKLTYAQLLHYYFRHIDPTDSGGQFCDRGPSYHSAVFVTPAQQADADAAKAEAQQTLGRNVVTRILPLGPFWPAEDYHQDYAIKNPAHYHAYRVGCGRDAAVAAVWRGR